MYFLPLLLDNKWFVLIQNMENLSPIPSHERTGSDHVELMSDGR